MAIAKLSIDIEARLANFERDLGKISNAAESTANRIKTSFAGVGAIVGSAFGALLAAGAVQQFQGLVNSLDQMAESSERIGLTTEALSGLAYAGKMSGLELDDMTLALTKLSGKMQDAASGSKEAKALFKDLGVNVKDASGNLKTADAIFAEVAERFAGLEDGAAKTALAVDIFGKSGAKLVPLLNGGAKGLKEMTDEAARLGGILDGKLAKQAADFNDNLDKLATLSASAGKSLASDLLPWLNEVAESFLIATKHSDGFWDTLNKKIPGLQIVDVAAELGKVRSEFEQIDFRISNGRAKPGDAERLASLQKEIDYYTELAKVKTKEAPTVGNGKIVRTPTDDKPPKTPKGPKGAKETVEASAEAKAYANSMEDLARITNGAETSQLNLTKSQRALLDLMSEPQWADMPEMWKEAAINQFEFAQSAEKAADEQKRLNDMLDATESAGIEKARKDMELLVTALEKGVISEEKYIEAASARLGLNKEAAKAATDDMDEFAKSAARNLQSSLADFLFDPFADGTKSMGDQFGKMLQRMAAEAASAMIMKKLFGEMGSTSGGGAGDWGWVGTIAKLFSGMSFDGGGSTGNGARSGGMDGKGGFMAILHPNETVIDHTKGQRIGGNSTTINQTIYAGQGTDKAEVRRSAAAGARAVLGAMGGAQRYA